MLVSDNASTDRSMEWSLVSTIQEFAGRSMSVMSGSRAIWIAPGEWLTGDRMMMLSSDDLLRPGTLATYRAFFESLGAAGERAVASAAVEVIDAEDRPIGRVGLPANAVWRESDRRRNSTPLPAGRFIVPGRELLRRCLLTMQNPFQFAATIYPRSLYQAVEGYGGGRQMNPDKWFHWKLLSKADTAYFIDRPMSSYRWHASNQTAHQAGSGALKYLVDEYVSTFEIDGRLLQELGLQRSEVERAFVEHDIGRHGLAALARGQRRQARRIYHYGKAVYPQHASKNWHVRALAVLLGFGPVGQTIARAAYRYRTRDNRASADNVWELGGSYR